MKIISQNESILLRIIDENELDIFTFDSLFQKLKSQIQLTYPTLNQSLQPTIEALVKRGLLSRIEKGKYCKHTFRNPYVIANLLVPEGVVAYWSALNLHGLTSQFTNTIFVQSPKLKRNKEVFGVSYQFVKVKASKMSGITTSGYGNNAFRMTNLEKTLVDCFDLPAYSGGVAELIVALSKAKLNNDRLIEATRAVDNIAVIKRLGFLLELLEKESMGKFLKYAQQCVKHIYNINVLDPSTEEQGVFNRRWNLRINIDEQMIVSMSKSQY